MLDCFILVGPEKWCQNHIDFLSNHTESWLLYDKISRNENLNDRARNMVNHGDFQTFIYVSHNWGGNRLIEYVAYSSSVKKQDFVPWMTKKNRFFLHKNLINDYKESIKEDQRKKNIPIEPPGLLPEWDYYDFGVRSRPCIIKDLRKYVREHAPRKYKTAIKICDVQRIEPKKLDDFEFYGGGSINTGHLNKSFIVARTNLDYRNLFD